MGLLSGRRILVVDDNADAADLLALILRSSGHEVATAYDGVEALALAELFRPEVAILDLTLPRMDGFALGRALRDRGLVSGPMIALSGLGEDAPRCREAGFRVQLVKPVDLEALEREILA